MNFEAGKELEALSLLMPGSSLQVYVQPSGFVSINGLAASTPFLKRVLERFKVQPLLFSREAYKNIVNQFTHVCLYSSSTFLLSMKDKPWFRKSGFFG